MLTLIDFQESFHLTVFIKEFNNSLLKSSTTRWITQSFIDTLVNL